MLYDMCMRSIERIEDLMASYWEEFPYDRSPWPMPDYETLDFEN